MPFDEREKEPLTGHDTENATKFHPSEAETRDPEYWKLMAGYNSGVYTRNWANQKKLRRMDKLAVFDALSGQLELTPYQKTVGRDRLDRLNVGRLGVSLELASFCICVLVAAADGRTYHPNRSEENNDLLFSQIADSLNETNNKITRCLNRIRSTDVGDVAY